MYTRYISEHPQIRCIRAGHVLFFFQLLFAIQQNFCHSFMAFLQNGRRVLNMTDCGEFLFAFRESSVCLSSHLILDVPKQKINV